LRILAYADDVISSSADQLAFDAAESQSQGMSVADEAESGYWDVVYLLYPEMAEAAGMGVLHDLVSSWPLIERSLAVHLSSHTNYLVTCCMQLSTGSLHVNWVSLRRPKD